MGEYHLVSAPQPPRSGCPRQRSTLKTISIVTNSNSSVCGPRHRPYQHPRTGGVFQNEIGPDYHQGYDGFGVRGSLAR